MILLFNYKSIKLKKKYFFFSKFIINQKKKYI